MKKNSFLKIFVFTLIFSFLIFIAKNYFFGGKQNLQNNIIEENYIEPIVLQQENEVNKQVINKKVEEKIIQNLNSANKIIYNFTPNDFYLEKDMKYYLDSISLFLNSSIIEKKITFLEVFFHKEKSDVRGKMQNKRIKLFGIYNMNLSEFLAVSIHEFGHFLDLYILEKKVTYDLSDYFYNISWINTTSIKAGLEQKDFVSGYSMTNKYEDFSESFTYYILHNSDFLEKSNNSQILKEKYDFFSRYVFRNDEFKTDNYKTNILIEPYYRDITKIDFSLEIFLQYLKK